MLCVIILLYVFARICYILSRILVNAKQFTSLTNDISITRNGFEIDFLIVIQGYVAIHWRVSSEIYVTHDVTHDVTHASYSCTYTHAGTRVHFVKTHIQPTFDANACPIVGQL